MVHQYQATCNNSKEVYCTARNLAEIHVALMSISCVKILGMMHELHLLYARMSSRWSI